MEIESSPTYIAELLKHAEEAEKIFKELLLQVINLHKVNIEHRDKKNLKWCLLVHFKP